MRELHLVVVMAALLFTGATPVSAGEPAAASSEQIVGFAIVPAPGAFDPYSIVSVCPINGSWGVFWHTPPGVDEEKASRARNQLQLSAFPECLELFVRTDPATLQIVENALRSTAPSGKTKRVDPDAADASIVAVQKRWTEFGVGEAIIEAAETNARGERVAKVMAACERLSAATKRKAN